MLFELQVNEFLMVYWRPVDVLLNELPVLQCLQVTHLRCLHVWIVVLVLTRLGIIPAQSCVVDKLLHYLA